MCLYSFLLTEYKLFDGSGTVWYCCATIGVCVLFCIYTVVADAAPAAG
jgi:hypothetical protein